MLVLENKEFFEEVSDQESATVNGGQARNIVAIVIGNRNILNTGDDNIQTTGDDNVVLGGFPECLCLPRCCVG
ncbi:MAG: hypothetical protein QNJ63_02665 [Calothrix sp. MO_192.B10]|nr:hypothetical protein [Calothrix sp. MO_192.B10]